MNTTQWILAIVFSLFIPITLAYLEAMSERVDVSDKGLITDRSEFPIRTALEEIKDSSIKNGIFINRTMISINQFTYERSHNTVSSQMEEKIC